MSTDNPVADVSPETTNVVAKAETKEEGKKRTRKKTTTEYPKVDGGYQSPSLEGFDAKIHAKPKLQDFADPLHYYEFEVGFYRAKAEASQEKANSLKSLGSTKEERSEALKSMKVLEEAKKIAAKLRESGSAQANKFVEQLGELFGTLSQG